MSRKERMDCDGCIISVELLHKLASDRRIEEIKLEDSVNGSQIRGCPDRTREYDRWELAFNDGARIQVYV